MTRCGCGAGARFLPYLQPLRHPLVLSPLTRHVVLRWRHGVVFCRAEKVQATQKSRGGGSGNFYFVSASLNAEVG